MNFRAKTDENREIDWNMAAINAYVKRWKPGTYLDVEITRKATSSDPIRSYYYAEVNPKMSEAMGYEPHEYRDVHKAAKGKYFEHQGELLKRYGIKEPPHMDKIGIWRNVPALFADDSVFPKEVKAAFLDWAIRRAGEHGAYIESPKGDNNGMA